MSSFCGPQIVPPTQKAGKHVIVLKILMVLQFLIAILNIVASTAFMRQGIFGLFFLLLLFSAYHKLSYQSLLIYTFISLFFTVTFLVYILTILQKGETLVDKTSAMSQYKLAVACISFVFYLFNSIYCFFPYRQFKSIQYSENPVFNQLVMHSGEVRNPQEMQDVKYAVDYGKRQPQRGENYQGTYEVFKGQGIRIG